MSIVSGQIRSSAPELLAPAGGMEQLRYAVLFGADAVYLATDRFGLRASAANFVLEEVPAAVAYAHKYGVKVYVTLNAYAHDSDIAALGTYIEALDQAGIDAVIVSDLGVLATVRAIAPQLAIHVSTQASVSNAAAVHVLYELGARRIVCAREMSLEEIAALRKAIPEDMQLEAFVHGAMCMAISGRCLLSDFLCDRPANQGACAQPCRWDYHLVEQTRPGQYFPIEEDPNGIAIMDSDDLCMLEHLEELAAAGIDSFKIEGRAKKAFYVATVINAYRQVMDGADPRLWMPELDVVSHRPYSTGFYYGRAHHGISEPQVGQGGDWVAQVVKVTSPKRAAYVRCRNRFYLGEQLEVLSPGKPVRSLSMKRIAVATAPHASSDVLGAASDPWAEVVDEEENLRFEDVEVANIAMGLYLVETDCELAAGDIIRSRRIDKSKKN